MNTQPLDDKTALDILLIRKWIEREIAKARELNLPALHLGWEMTVNGIALMAPGVTLEQAREIFGAVVNELVAKLNAAQAAKPTETTATAQGPNVVSLRGAANANNESAATHQPE